MTAVNITVNMPEKSIEEVPEVVNFVRAMVEKIRPKYPDIDFRLTGIVFMNNSFTESSQGDLKTLIPIMYLLIIGVMAVVLRSFWGTIAIVLVVAWGDGSVFCSLPYRLPRPPLFSLWRLPTAYIF